ncbi:MAG TPA: SUF system NifU family Fe-S cluster assembly protein [Gemmatimonadales bacterium]|nr:SUF system NifU family Fe-S cluster assembly protein [Gemmatimonadales bacterium]
MADLTELYQQTIVEHNRSPRNFKTLDHPTHHADGNNPLCGDQISLQLKVDGDVIKEVGFQGSGCAISRASASLMTSAVMGKTSRDAEQLFQAFHDMVTGGPKAPADPTVLGKLAAFAGVRQFPARVKCANLAWHTLHAALQSDGTPISTE